jgi:antitoxin HicB
MYTIRLSLELNEESGVYTVTSPDVPGLVTEGSEPDEINQNVQEALEGLMEVWKDLGMEIPEALQDAKSRPPQSAEILVTA